MFCIEGFLNKFFLGCVIMLLCIVHSTAWCLISIQWYEVDGCGLIGSFLWLHHRRHDEPSLWQGVIQVQKKCLLGETDDHTMNGVLLWIKYGLWGGITGTQSGEGSPNSGPFLPMLFPNPVTWVGVHLVLALLNCASPLTPLRIPRRSNGELWLCLTGLVVHKDLYRLGIGQFLVKLARQACHDHGYVGIASRPFAFFQLKGFARSKNLKSSQMVDSGCSTVDGKPFWLNVGSVFDSSPDFVLFTRGHTDSRKYVNVGTDSAHISSLDCV